MKIKENTRGDTVRTEEREADGIRYKYTLSVSESTRVASYKMPLYSISVEMTDALGVTTESSLEDVFSSSERAFSFFDRLTDNLATPIDLPYIFEDEMK